MTVCAISAANYSTKMMNFAHTAEQNKLQLKKEFAHFAKAKATQKRNFVHIVDINFNTKKVTISVIFLYKRNLSDDLVDFYCEYNKLNL